MPARGKKPRGRRGVVRGVHNKPTYRFDTSKLVDAIKRSVLDGQAAPEIALIYQPDDGPHYEFIVEDGVVKEILLEVEIVSTGDKLTARYATCTSGGLSGVFNIPDPGTEVLVLMDGGDLVSPVVVAQLGGGGFPLAAQQAVGGRVVIVGETEVVITDPMGGGEGSLPTMDDFEALRNWIADDMVVVTPGGNSDPGTLDPPPSPTGTTVLKTK